ncbi:MAG: DUF262 domain-containing protein [Thermoplasmataceae archaeon]
MDNLTNLQDLFQKFIFKVPDYQRGYSWEPSNVEDLLDDLDSLDVGGQHYTGTIVLLESGNKPGLGRTYSQCDLVDGQQRLTTLSILVKSITKILEDGSSGFSEDERKSIISNLTSTYLWEKGKEGKVYKLTLETTNDHFFKNKILNEVDVESLTVSHSRLSSASQIIYDHLLEKSDDDGYIKELIDKITNSLVFTVYYVNDNSDVGVIFETMNDRGMTLTDLEKVKNHLLYLTSKVTSHGIPREDTSIQINSSWINILKNLYVSSFEELKEDQLLQISLVLKFYNDLKDEKENGKVIKSINSQLGEQYRMVKEYFKKLMKTDREKCHSEILNYATFLENLSEKYRDIMIPNHPKAFSFVTDEEIRDRIKLSCVRYNRIGGQTSILPLMVAIYLKYQRKPEILAALFELIEKVAFRMYGLSESRSYTARTQFRSIACSLYRGTLNDDLFNKIRDIGISYSYTVKDSLTYEKTDYYKWRWVKYFLYEYEIWRCKESSRGFPSIAWNSLEKLDKDESIEHILPETYPDRVPYWTSRFSKEDHEYNYKRIGNLTLTDQNQILFNKGFDEKVKHYRNSSWQLERDLSTEYSDWDEESIGKREEAMVKFAEERWKL